MRLLDDAELLSTYASKCSEAAFATLVDFLAGAEGRPVDCWTVAKEF